MIANSEINENGNIFSHLFLICLAGFLKNHLAPPPLFPLPFFWNVIILSEIG